MSEFNQSVEGVELTVAAVGAWTNIELESSVVAEEANAPRARSEGHLVRLEGGAHAPEAGLPKGTSLGKLAVAFQPPKNIEVPFSAKVKGVERRVMTLEIVGSGEGADAGKLLISEELDKLGSMWFSGISYSLS